MSDSGSDPNLIKLSENSITLFYAPWCSHCKAYKPMWGKIENSFKNTKINVYSVNVDEYRPSLYSHLRGNEVTTVPTIVTIKNSKVELWKGINDPNILKQYFTKK